MGRSPGPELDPALRRPAPPPWEPYLFTGTVLVGLTAFLVACGLLADWLERVPWIWPVLLTLLTAAGIYEALKAPPVTRPLAGFFFLTLFLTLSAAAQAGRSQPGMALWYGLLAAVWLFLSVQAAIVRHSWQKARSAKLARAVQTLRQATVKDDTPAVTD